MAISHFDIKISKFTNRLIFNIHVGDGKKIKFLDCTSLNNRQMKLKLTFTRYYLSIEQNNFF